MINIRKAEERGHFNHGWLDTYHTFSFADYHDPKFMGFGHYQDPAHMGFRSLRVINEDRVIPGAGFPRHGHKDMEIISYVLEGALEHKDSLGNGTVIRPGEVQRMSAGTGVMHSETNPSNQAAVHFLQIWILPERQSIAPSYEQKTFPIDERKGRLRLVASPDGRDGSLTVHQDVDVFAATLDGATISHDFRPKRYGWLQVARGTVDLNGQTLRAGDGAAIEGERRVNLRGDGEVLLFDLN